MDVFTPEKRSQVMSRIRGRDTKPEIVLRSMLHRAGYRFTVNGPLNACPCCLEIQHSVMACGTVFETRFRFPVGF
jgi:G:T-mismatch repair DNA endonuclease (very short patch repair protein)